MTKPPTEDAIRATLTPTALKLLDLLESGHRVQRGDGRRTYYILRPGAKLYDDAIAEAPGQAGDQLLEAGLIREEFKGVLYEVPLVDRATL